MQKSLIDHIAGAKRVVIKIGSALLIDNNTSGLRADWLKSLVQQIAEIKRDHPSIDILIVSSGAIALGRHRLKIPPDQPSSSLALEEKQAAASIGQVYLTDAYNNLFLSHDMTIGQILLSTNDTENRRSYLNARSTLFTLFKHGAIPIINENDTVSTHEIRFGDNDRLAARVAQMIEADLMILFSNMAGVYNKNPHKYDDAIHIPYISKIDSDILSLADDSGAILSSGGMSSKLQAAKTATESGCHTIIADGTGLAPLAQKNTENHPAFTMMQAQEKTPKSGWKKWISGHLKPSGSVYIDQGAAKALLQDKSLLPAGVVEIDGDFRRGDLVLIKNADKQLIARGLIAYDSDQAKQIMGKQSFEIESILGFPGRAELVHRDNLINEKGVL